MSTIQFTANAYRIASLPRSNILRCSRTYNNKYFLAPHGLLLLLHNMLLHGDLIFYKAEGLDRQGNLTDLHWVVWKRNVVRHRVRSQEKNTPMSLYLAVTIELIVFSSCGLSSESLVLTLLVTYRTRQSVSNLKGKVKDYHWTRFYIYVGEFCLIEGGGRERSVQ